MCIRDSHWTNRFRVHGVSSPSTEFLGPFKRKHPSATFVFRSSTWVALLTTSSRLCLLTSAPSTFPVLSLTYLFLTLSFIEHRITSQKNVSQLQSLHTNSTSIYCDRTNVPRSWGVSLSSLRTFSFFCLFSGDHGLRRLAEMFRHENVSSRPPSNSCLLYTSRCV